MVYNEYKEYTIPTDATFLLFSIRVGSATDGSADRNSGDDDYALKVYYDGVLDGSLKVTYTGFYEINNADASDNIVDKIALSYGGSFGKGDEDCPHWKSWTTGGSDVDLRLAGYSGFSRTRFYRIWLKLKDEHSDGTIKFILDGDDDDTDQDRPRVHEYLVLTETVDAEDFTIQDDVDDGFDSNGNWDSNDGTTITVDGTAINMNVGWTAANYTDNRLVEVSGGGGGGDPYIIPMLSAIPVKLPDIEQYYRLFEQGNNYINVQVSKATDEHQKRMKSITNVWREKLGTAIVPEKVMSDGFFFSKVFISAEGNKLMVDMYKHKVTSIGACKSDFFTIRYNERSRGNKMWRKERCMCTYVSWKDENGSDITVELQLYKNPHIENGVNIKVAPLSDDAIGLCVKNYRPKLMVIPSLTKGEYLRLRKKVDNAAHPFQQKYIKPMDRLTYSIKGN